jgi:DDE superfamily endonuclease
MALPPSGSARYLSGGLGYKPRRLVTDGLRSYDVAQRAILPEVRHRTSRYLNNRAENSHRPTRRRERQMQRFKSDGQAQRFLSAHAMIYGHFRPRRHLMAMHAPLPAFAAEQVAATLADPGDAGGVWMPGQHARPFQHLQRLGNRASGTPCPIGDRRMRRTGRLSHAASAAAIASCSLDAVPAAIAVWHSSGLIALWRRSTSLLRKAMTVPVGVN